MKRKIIRIDQEMCNGCGACAAACHEGAIEMVDGTAVLTREDYCDGLGDCLPACPTGAITFEVREAPAYDHAAVLAAKGVAHTGCPGSAARSLSPHAAPPQGQAGTPQASCLRQWPVQLKLAPLSAPYFQGADLLLAADCAAYAHAAFHSSFMAGRVTLIGCPKLDGVDYSEKLAAILAQNDIRSLTVVRMEVPCCGGLEHAARRALDACGKALPLQVATLSIQGGLLPQ